MTKQAFYRNCPTTRKEFIKKYKGDYVFRNWAQVFGFSVIGDNVIFPTGKVADNHVK